MATNQLALIAGSQTVVTTAETTVATSAAISTGPGALGVWFSGDILMTPGTGATAVRIVLRAGSSAGTQLDITAAIPVTAGVPTQVPYNLYDLTDISQKPGGQVYVIDVVYTGASANSTINGGHMGVEV